MGRPPDAAAPAPPGPLTPQHASVDPRRLPGRRPLERGLRRGPGRAAPGAADASSSISAACPRTEASELVRLRAGGTPSLGFLQALYEETEGNPFFIEEIVRHLVDSGVRTQEAGARRAGAVGLPDDVREVISRRLERLDAPAIEWLRAAAVIGRDFEPELLEKVLGFDEDRFLAALEDALGRGAGQPRRPGEPGPLQLLARARSARRCTRGCPRPGGRGFTGGSGVALEDLDPEHPEAQISALALHFTRAAEGEDAERAIRYALQAGEQATAMLANEEAADALRPGAGRAGAVRSGGHDRAAATSCSGSARPGCAAASGRWRGRPSGRRPSLAGRARRQRQPGPGGDRRLPPLHPATRRRRRGADRAAGAGAGADSRPTQARRGWSLVSRLCGALYFSERREQMRALSDEATAIAAELAIRRRRRWRPRPAGGRTGGPRELRAPPGGLDRAAAVGAGGDGHRADPPGARLARRRPPGGRGPARGRGPDRAFTAAPSDCASRCTCGTPASGTR